MNLQYIINKRTNGANPFKIFEALKIVDAGALSVAIRGMSYQAFLESSYWFAVSTVAKSNAGMRCQVCNSSTELNVHHRTYDCHGREHLCMIDLVVLCGNCHGLFHGHKDVLPQFKPAPKVRKRRQLVIPHSEADLNIPEGDTVVLTMDSINNCRCNGTFTNATLRAFGVKKADMAKGWVARLVGRRLTREQYKEAAEGRYHYGTGRLQ